MRSLLIIFLLANASAGTAQGFFMGDTLRFTFESIDDIVGSLKKHEDPLERARTFEQPAYVLGGNCRGGRETCRVHIIDDTITVNALLLDNVARSLRQERQQSHRERQMERSQESAEMWLAGLRSQGIPVVFTNVSHSINSAGGVEPRFVVRNISNRTIKYVRITVAAFNSVGDRVYDEIRGGGTFTVRLVGPIETGEQASYDFEYDPPFYNNVASCIEMRRAVIDFMDGGNYTMVNDLRTARPNPRSGENRYNVRGECSR